MFTFFMSVRYFSIKIDSLSHWACNPTTIDTSFLSNTTNNNNDATVLSFLLNSGCTNGLEVVEREDIDKETDYWQK